MIGQKIKNMSLHKRGQTLPSGLRKKELQSWHIQLGMSFAKCVSPAGVRPPAPTPPPAGGTVPDNIQYVWLNMNLR